MTKREFGVVLVLVAALLPCGAAFKLDFGMKARLNQSLQHARQCALALRVYAGDAGGLYPKGADANAAFAKLVEEIGTEKIFYVPGSAWHGWGDTQKGPDNLWEGSEPPGKALGPGENAYAYATGLNDASPARLALIASGFSDTVGVYSKDPNKRGGVWRGSRCVVVYCDGAGQIATLNAEGKFIDPDRPGRDVFGEPDHPFVNPTMPDVPEPPEGEAAADPGKGEDG